MYIDSIDHDGQDCQSLIVEVDVVFRTDVVQGCVADVGVPTFQKAV